MDIATMLVSAGVGGGVGIASNALMFWRNAGITDAEFKTRLEAMKTELQHGAGLMEKTNSEFTGELKGIINELRAVVLTVAKLQSSQDVVNSVTATTLASLARKLEEQDKAISELQGSVSFIRQLFERMERQGR